MTMPRTIMGKFVAYRYYGDTSSTYNHGGIVVIASHHDKDTKTIHGGLCVVPDHVTRKIGTSITEFIPHKYERKAARTIADARLHFAMFGTWSEEIDTEIENTATWSLETRKLTDSEIEARLESVRGKIVASESVSIEEILTKHEAYLRNAAVPSVNAKNLHREESSFSYTYDTMDINPDSEYELTYSDIDAIIVEQVEKLVSEMKLPSWVGEVVVSGDLEDDLESVEDGDLRVVSGPSDVDNESRVYSIARVKFDSLNTPVAMEFLTDSFDSVEDLNSHIENLIEVVDESYAEGIVRTEALNDDTDETLEYIEKEDPAWCSDDDEDNDSEDEDEDDDADDPDEVDNDESEDKDGIKE